MNNSDPDENKHAARRRCPPVSSRLSANSSGGFERSHFSGLSVSAAVLFRRFVGIRRGVSARGRTEDPAADAASLQARAESQTAPGTAPVESLSRVRRPRISGISGKVCDTEEAAGVTTQPSEDTPIPNGDSRESRQAPVRAELKPQSR